MLRLLRRRPVEATQEPEEPEPHPFPLEVIAEGADGRQAIRYRGFSFEVRCSGDATWFVSVMSEGDREFSSVPVGGWFPTRDGMVNRATRWIDHILREREIEEDFRRQIKEAD